MGYWGKCAYKRDFGLKLVFWGKMTMQRDFWVKNGVLGENGRAKGL